MLAPCLVTQQPSGVQWSLWSHALVSIRLGDADDRLGLQMLSSYPLDIMTATMQQLPWCLTIRPVLYAQVHSGF